MKYALSITAILVLGAILFFALKDRNEQNTPRNTTGTQTSATTTEDIFTIVAFGDSLTAGYGIDIEDSYPAQLEKRLIDDGYKVRVINMGVSGETTTAGLDRVDFVLSQNPDLILLGLGANDMLRGTSPTVTAKNLDSIVSKITAAKIPLVLLGMQSAASNGREFTAAFNAIYPNLSKKYTAELVPFFLEGVVLKSDLNTQDGIHPNKDGYAYIVENHILPVVKNIIPKN